ncbi:hypothetical protein WGT02_32450 (plasmid) [Rhizobium sp. T1470]|uniref:hypothetical protein n=1 Tax=unclassified Rhizobium TaxID=2613769 RepID=UPI001AAE2E16|nr:hypothetical protein [Rhizobium sp. T1473]MCA0806456.1 hypothetical protein [Rhizobium sp. T1473]
MKGIKVTDRLLRLPIAYTTTAKRSVHQRGSDRQETPAIKAFNDFLIRKGPALLPLIGKPYPAAAFGGKQT